MKYAIISVSDKSNLDILVKGLVSCGYRIISTGGTYKAIQEIIQKEGLKIKLHKVSEITKSPEMLGGRVKTLHPRIHGSILYDRDNKTHLKEARENKLLDIDLVVLNLYPFEDAMKNNVCDDALIEEIDIGGPTMLVSCVKNHKHVTIVTDPKDYEELSMNIKKDGSVSSELRNRYAVKAINLLADYRGMIAQELSRRYGLDTLRLSFLQGRKLGRYGENWHQQAWLYSCTGLSKAEQLSGIALGYNNYLDANAALFSIRELSTPGVSIVKHSNPCGYATGKDLTVALERAWEGDDVSSFGSIIAFSRKLDLKTARFFDKKFIELIIVPDIEDEALKHLVKKPKLRILKLDYGPGDDREYRSLDGGLLSQSMDDKLFLGGDLLAGVQEIDDSGTMRKVGIVTKETFERKMLGLVKFSIKSVKHLRSNAISICYEYEKGQYMLLGMGCGQPNRINSVHIAIAKALHNLKVRFTDNLAMKILSSEKVVLCSDAFFPFRDSLDELSKHGIKYIVQPGGSINDPEVIEAADEHKMGMVFTGMRHFRH